MKIRYALLAAALALALTGCQAEEPTGTAPLPPEPSPTAGVPLRTPPELPSPEELLAGGELERVMGVRLGRAETEEGWRYFYR